MQARKLTNSWRAETGGKYYYISHAEDGSLVPFADIEMGYTFDNANHAEGNYYKTVKACIDAINMIKESYKGD